MKQELKYLPVGQSDIVTILTNNFIYVDKTKYVYDMVKIHSKYFLSRPRRFGKSTLVSTLYEVFKGNKELFKEQWIYTSSWDWQEYPVIKLDFNVELNIDLPSFIKQKLKRVAEEYDVFDEEEFNQLSYGLYFDELIYKLYHKYKKQVVVLIDEYDKPILDVIDNVEEAENKLDILKGFYGVMKGLDRYLRFIFLTGVTRFSKVGVFSDLNNLDDISMNNEYADICGINQCELENYFAPYIDNLAVTLNLNRAACLMEIKRWYNGFYFSENMNLGVYNPFSTLLLFNNNKFSNYWFASGSPSFLIKLIKQEADLTLSDFENVELSISGFDTFEINNLNLHALLFQAGYLTIKAYDDKIKLFTLGYTNYEIERAFKENLLDSYFKTAGNSSNYLSKLYNAFNKSDLEEVNYQLGQIFLNLNYDIQVSKEQNFQNMIYLIFRLLGYMIETEYKTQRGRIDAIVFTSNSVYIFEFKINQNAKVALAQIHEKEYYVRFLKQHKAIYLVGINFNTERQIIDDYLYEELSNSKI